MSISTDVVALNRERILAMKPMKSFCNNIKVSSLEYSSDGLRLLAVTNDNNMRLFDLNDGSSLRIVSFNIRINQVINVEFFRSLWKSME